MLSALIDRFQAKFPPNRLVVLAMALLVPTVITPVAAFLAAWLPAHVPGLPVFSVAQLTTFGVTGGAAALLAGTTAGYKFLDGWQKHESRTFFGNEPNNEVEIAKIEAETQQIVALINSGQVPESVMHLLQGPPQEGVEPPVSSSHTVTPPVPPVVAPSS